MAKLLDFHKNPSTGWYRFRIGDGGDPAEFRIAIQRLKQMIPLQHRNWLPREKYWEVAPIEANEKALYAIFENGATCIGTLKSQLRLFD